MAKSEGVTHTAADLGDNVFVINSFSKYFNMTGWRLGWMVAPERYIRELDKLSQNIYLSAPTPAQLAALVAFQPETHVLIIDDFAISPMGARERTDLLELLDDRVGARATLITSQLPIENWHDYIGDPTLADAIMDRLVHGAHKIHIEGETMRKRAAADKQNTGSKAKKFD